MALVVLSLAQLMDILDSTIVNIALPTAQRDLGFPADYRQWVLTGYALAFGSLLLLGGRLSDFFGRKRLFLIGIGGFAVASAFGGAAGDFAMLLAARIAQGAFAAMLAPAALSLLSVTFADDAKERGRAFGIFGAISGAGGALGLLLGGVLTQGLSWRWCLYVNLIIAAIAFVGGLVFLRDGDRPERVRPDIAGTVTVVLGLIGIVYGLGTAETHGWNDIQTIGPVIAGVALVGVFVLIERRTKHPLLPLRVVLDRVRGTAYLSLEPDHDFDLIVLSVPHHRLAEAAAFLAPRVGQATVLVLGNIWTEPLAAIGALPVDRIAWGFPQAGGGFDADGVLCGGMLLPSVIFGTLGQPPTDRERAVRQVFREAGFRPKERPDFRGWLWVHFVSDAALFSQGLRLGSLSKLAGSTSDFREALLTGRELLPLLQARGVDLRRHRVGVLLFRAPTWLTARTFAWLTAHVTPLRVNFEAHSDPDAEEPREVCRDTLAEARRLGIAVPRLEAAEPNFAREGTGRA
jgi:MFS family permease